MLVFTIFNKYDWFLTMCVITICGVDRSTPFNANRTGDFNGVVRTVRALSSQRPAVATIQVRRMVPSSSRLGRPTLRWFWRGTSAATPNPPRTRAHLTTQIQDCLECAGRTQKCTDAHDDFRNRHRSARNDRE